MMTEKMRESRKEMTESRREKRESKREMKERIFMVEEMRNIMTRSMRKVQHLNTKIENTMMIEITEGNRREWMRSILEINIKTRDMTMCVGMNLMREEMKNLCM